jgi:[methyl-Co(III) methanol-specific corrinoid protein]:coenzyme M methyltransferase
MAALDRQPVDRPPVANPTNVATVELLDMVDTPFPDACRDPELAARRRRLAHRLAQTW